MAVAGEWVEFRVVASADKGVLSYVWQRAPSGSASWSDLAEGGS